jgi:hypothetical protein
MTEPTEEERARDKEQFRAEWVAIKDLLGHLDQLNNMEDISERDRWEAALQVLIQALCEMEDASGEILWRYRPFVKLRDALRELDRGNEVAAFQPAPVNSRPTAAEPGIILVAGAAAAVDYHKAEVGRNLWGASNDVAQALTDAGLKNLNGQPISNATVFEWRRECRKKQNGRVPAGATELYKELTGNLDLGRSPPYPWRLFLKLAVIGRLQDCRPVRPGGKEDETRSQQEGN